MVVGAWAMIIGPIVATMPGIETIIAFAVAVASVMSLSRKREHGPFVFVLFTRALCIIIFNLWLS